MLKITLIFNVGRTQSDYQIQGLTRNVFVESVRNFRVRTPASDAKLLRLVITKEDSEKLLINQVEEKTNTKSNKHNIIMMSSGPGSHGSENVEVGEW